MTAAIPRRNPRRPFQITPQGLKRIVLGQTGDAGAAMPVSIQHVAATKPLRLTQAAASHILVIAHSDRGALDAHAHQAIAAAALLADPATAVAVLVLGELSEDLGAFGADQVFAAPACDRARFNPALELAVAADLVAHLDPLHILLPDTSGVDGDLGRRLAARIGGDIAGHIVELRPDAVAAYWQGGAQLARRDLPRLVLLDPDTTDLALPFCGQGTSIDRPMPASIDNASYADLGSPPLDAATLSLEEADFIVAAGNGVSDVPAVRAVAQLFDAAIGASRVAVDDGRFSRDQQVGATGRTVTANVYLAIGISGAVQHLQGIRACRHVIAVNTDASAPIAKRADLTIVDDAQAVMQALLDARSSRNFPQAEPAAPPLAPEGRGRAAAAGAGALQPQRRAALANTTRTLVLAAMGRNPVSGAARPNRNDLLALELARQFGDVALLHAGDPAEPALSDYLAYGATTLDIIPAAPGHDIVQTLANRAAGYDLILAGSRAEGGQGSGTVPYLLAERLGLPLVAQALDIAIADGHAEITQGLARGQRRRVRVKLPAVVVVHPNAPQTPHFAFARRSAGRIQHLDAITTGAAPSPWRAEPAGKRPVKFRAAETKAGHARMLSAIVAEARGGAVIASGTPADKAQAILTYLRDHKLIDW